MRCFFASVFNFAHNGAENRFVKSVLFDWLKTGLYQELDKYEVFIYLFFLTYLLAYFLL